MNFLLTSDSGITSITSAATSLLTWALTSMTSIAKWIIDTPAALILFAIAIVSLGFGFVFRVLRKL